MPCGAVNRVHTDLGDYTGEYGPQESRDALVGHAAVQHGLLAGGVGCLHTWFALLQGCASLHHADQVCRVCSAAYACLRVRR